MSGSREARNVLIEPAEKPDKAKRGPGRIGRISLPIEKH